MAQFIPVDTKPAFVPTPITDAEAATLFRAALGLFRRRGLTDPQAATLLDLPPRTYRAGRRWGLGGSREIRGRACPT